MADMVTFLDLAATNDPVRRVVLRDLDRLAAASSFTLGAVVAEFEEQWAAYCGAKHCVGVGSGTDALTFALRAHGLDDGQKVLVPAMTFQATWEAVTHAGGVPMPVDVGDNYCMHIDGGILEWWECALTVDLYGHPSSVPAKIVDASQSHGVRHPGVTCTYSFFPTKNLGGWGDGGAVVTDDEGLADEVRELRTHGGTTRGQHDRVGATSRLDAVQAAVLLRKLPYLDLWNDQRREAAEFYLDGLRGYDTLVLPQNHPEHVWHIFAVQSPHRDRLAAHLAAHGIGTAVHYPTPPHLTPAYAHLGYNLGDFPVAERLASDGLSLPLWPGITEAQQNHVINAVRSFTLA